MGDGASSVTLIFREREKNWRNEHPINLMAAIVTNSKFHHVEIALGSECGQKGQMKNVLRIFNDAVCTPGALAALLSVNDFSYAGWR